MENTNDTTTKVVGGMHVVLVRQYDGKQGQTAPASPSAPITTKVIEKKVSLVSSMSTLDVPIVQTVEPSQTVVDDSIMRKPYIEYGLIGGAAAALVGYLLYQSGANGSGN